MTREGFEKKIRKAAKNRQGFFFSETAHSYYAEYRPKSPEESAADFLITYNPNTKKTTLIAGTAAVPIFKEYTNFNGLLSELREME